MPFSRGFYVCIAAALVAVVVQPMRPIMVHGQSMDPTYASGTILWTTPIDRPLERGDVVIADTPEGRVIKRVALLPGDSRLQWSAFGKWGDLLMTGLPRTAAGRRLLRDLPVPEGTVFLLGDNLESSIDSRSFGPVSITDVHRIVIDQRPPDTRAGIEQDAPRNWLVRGTGGLFGLDG